MAIVFTEGGKAPDLSECGRKLYDAICGQDWELASNLQNAYPTARHELLRWGLISDENPPVARDPQAALRAMVSRELEEAISRIQLVTTMPELSRHLIHSYRKGQLRAGGTSVYLADPETVNARLQDAVDDARWEILAAQPGGPRKPEVLDGAIARDSAALDRGVKLRTIYRESVREHAVTAKYAQQMSARTGGRPAQYRTLPGDFERMIIIDRELAFIEDHIVENSPPHAAWLVTDPAVVAVLARQFDAKWRRALPWCGELRQRAGAGDGVDTVSGTGGVRTDRYQRTVLRLLCAGESQTAAARKMGVSKRKLEEDVAVLKDLWGVRTLNELIFQFALSPDQLIDDNVPDLDGDIRPGVA